jgi:hypothetical protein
MGFVLQLHGWNGLCWGCAGRAGPWRCCRRNGGKICCMHAPACALTQDFAALSGGCEDCVCAELYTHVAIGGNLGSVCWHAVLGS